MNASAVLRLLIGSHVANGCPTPSPSVRYTSHDASYPSWFHLTSSIGSAILVPGLSSRMQSIKNFSFERFVFFVSAPETEVDELCVDVWFWS